MPVGNKLWSKNKENNTNMKNNIVKISFVILYLSITCLKQVESKQDHYFDFLIFTQHWPVTVCKEWIKENHSHTCNFPHKQQTWTVHGIWPTKNGTIGPAFCDNSWHFDPEKIKPIESKLMELWIDVENGMPEYSLWVHEWTKHGTCAAQLDSLNSEYKYFSKAIDWMPNFELTTSLAQSNIIPSDDKLYKISDIQQAIRDKWKVNPQIECRGEHGTQYLFEIRLCFSKSLELIDCYAHDKIETNCNIQKGVMYPKTASPSKPSWYTYMQLYKLLYWVRWFTL